MEMKLNERTENRVSQLEGRNQLLRAGMKFLFRRLLPLRRGLASSSIKELSYSVFEPDGKGGKGGSPLLVTHGLLGARSNWASIAKAVSKATGRKVITFDARNHGDSAHSPEHNYSLMADDLTELISSLKLQNEKVSVMGHSMGGRTAMTFALTRPEMLDRLVVVDVSPVSLQSQFHSEMASYMDKMLSVEFPEGKSLALSEARRIADRELRPVVPDAAVRAFLLTNLAERKETGEIYWKPNLKVLHASISEIGNFPTSFLPNARFDGRSLLIRGEKSSYVPDQDLPEIRKLFPDIRVETIKGAGHWPHSENSRQFLEVLIQFLNS